MRDRTAGCDGAIRIEQIILMNQGGKKRTISNPEEKTVDTQEQRDHIKQFQT
jgi:hypothetical protein